MEKLVLIQSELKAPKNQYNAFGKYKYRAAEDILEALKPLLKKYKATLCLTDDLILVGDRYYIKATATISIEDQTVSVSAFARESATRKGMDDSQITGTASTYARKYALNGLFLIDDTKDADHDAPAENGKSQEPKKVQMPAEAAGTISETQAKSLVSLAKMNKFTKEDLKEIIYCLGYTALKDVLKQDASTIIETLSQPAEQWRAKRDQVQQEYDMPEEFA